MRNGELNGIGHGWVDSENFPVVYHPSAGKGCGKSGGSGAEAHGYGNGFAKLPGTLHGMSLMHMARHPDERHRRLRAFVRRPCFHKGYLFELHGDGLSSPRYDAFAGYGNSIGSGFDICAGPMHCGVSESPLRINKGETIRTVVER